MKRLFLDYSKWTSVRKAKAWLKDNNIEVEFRSLISDTPTKEEIKNWAEKFNVSIEKFFNVNGVIFKTNNLKEKIKDMSLDECCEMLSQEGMLIKRPIYIDDNVILFGFKQKEWEESLMRK